MSTVIFWQTVQEFQIHDGQSQESTGIRGLMRGMATLPQGNQELLVVRDKVGRPPGELRVNKSFIVLVVSIIVDTCIAGPVRVVVGPALNTVM